MYFSAVYRLHVDIAGRSHARGVKQGYGWGENKLFSSKMHQYLENGRRYVQSYHLWLM